MAALVGVVLALPVLVARAQIPAPLPLSPNDALAPHPDSARVYSLAARFSPGQQAAIGVQALSPTGAQMVGPLELTLFHLQDQVYHAVSDPVTLQPDTPTTVEFRWTPPQTDFTGYLAVVSVSGRVNGGLDAFQPAKKLPVFFQVAQQEGPPRPGVSSTLCTTVPGGMF